MAPCCWFDSAEVLRYSTSVPISQMILLFLCFALLTRGGLFEHFSNTKYFICTCFNKNEAILVCYLDTNFSTTSTSDLFELIQF